ncbi:MAG: TonB-dependent receptor plug domain-containing protein, partial [Pyrinomonadaceae bacterium]
MTLLRRFFLVFIAGVLMTVFVANQFTVEAQSSTGTIQGSILDPIGGAVPDASVEIVELKRRIISAAAGTYQFANVPPGDYTIRIVAEGYNQALSPVISLTSGNAITQDISFKEVRGSVNQVDVIGTDRDAIAEIPGSVAVITREELRASHPMDANEVLRRVTGVHVREDSGPVALRLNVGIRGLNPDRSRQILVLEDGIPLALAPYGEPELYYSPPIDRMRRVEILKGSGSILYGPQTVGGVINFVTPDPPQTPQGAFEIIGGQRDFLTVRGNYGGTIGKFGGYASFLRKQGNGFRSFYFNVTDFTGKATYALTDRQTLAAKLTLYDEGSNSTYLGLTQSQFARDPNENAVPDDRLNIRRFFGSLNHQFVINSNTLLNTTAYSYNTVRNWRRQDFDRVRNASRRYVGVFGDESIPGGAV